MPISKQSKNKIMIKNILQKQIEELKEILSNNKDLTSEDVWTDSEKVKWLISSQSELLKAVDKVIEKHNDIIRERLKYCQEQNGRDECKNCGLNEEDDILDTLQPNPTKEEIIKGQS